MKGLNFCSPEHREQYLATLDKIILARLGMKRAIVPDSAETAIELRPWFPPWNWCRFADLLASRRSFDELGAAHRRHRATLHIDRLTGHE